MSDKEMKINLNINKDPDNANAEGARRGSLQGVASTICTFQM